MKNQGFGKIRSRLKSLKVPILILLMGILLIWILYWDARKDALEQLRKQFVIDAATRASIIHDALENHLIDLEGLCNFYNASTSVTRKAFATFVAPTFKTRPGIQAFEWIPRVAYPERARFEAEASRNGLQDYQIYHLDPKSNKVAAGPRQYYYPVYYVEPLAGNEPAVGFDLGSNPARLAALEQAADTGQAVATERIRLVQETGTQAGFLIFIPVYRQEMPLKTVEQRRMALHGFVLGVFRAGDAVEAAVRPSPEKGLLTELVDLHGVADTRLLHRFERGQLHLKVVTWKTLLAPSVTLRYEHPFTYAGRQWMVDIIASPAYVQGHISLSYWLIPPIGVLLMLLLTLNFGALLSHKVSAYARSLIEASLDPLVTISPEGKIMDVNHAMEIVTGVTREELIGQDFSDYFTEPEKAREGYQQVFSQGMVQDYPLVIRHVSGATTPVIYSASVYRDESEEIQGVFAAARNITKRKQAEEALMETNAKLEIMVSEANQRNRETTLITSMSESLQACLNCDEAYPIIAHSAQQLFAAISGGLFMLDPAGNFLEMVTSWGETLAGEKVFAPNNCWAIRRGQIYLSGGSTQDERCRHLPDKAAGCYLCIPLMAQGGPLGLLHLQAPCEVDSSVIDQTKDLAVTVGDNISLALANLKLRETLRQQVIHDPLTGLFNRRYLDETLEREIHRVRRKRAFLGVIMMDLDHFKRFNDTYGHEVGDSLLQTLGKFLETQVRQEDIVCRYGGEEFVLILPEASLDITQKRAEEIRQGVSQLQVSHRGRVLEMITVSLGVAIFPDHGATGEDVLRAADDAMYKAKAAGRNRVVVAEGGV